MAPTTSSTATALCWRTRLVAATVFLMLAAVGLRLVHVQALGRHYFSQRALQQRTYMETIAPRPGDIVDRNGRLLATTVTAQSLFLIPDQIAEPMSFAQQLAPALELDPYQLYGEILSRRDKQFMWVKRRLTDAEVQAVRNLKLPPETWGFRDEYLRRYPQGSVAAHVLGLRNIDGRGRGGVEEGYDDALGGQLGRRVLLRDARGRVIDIQEDQTQLPRHGRTLVLSIDTIVQLFAERELDQLMEEWRPKGACVTVLDPRSGDVLAMASRPTFDPNLPINVPEEAWKNLNIAAVFEPGSTFKPFVVAWGLQMGVLQPNETFYCENGLYQMGSRLLHDHHPYGNLNVTDILVKSSNVGMAKIGERLGNELLYEATVNFGFGRKTGCRLPGEVEGIVRPLTQWTSYSTGSVPIGQEIAVTPLQLITAHAALANGGRLIAPQLVLAETDNPRAVLRNETDAAATTSVVSELIDAEIARWLVEGPMTEVVKRGTGVRAKLKDFVVFGKTGTAQKMDWATGQYSKTRVINSFVCGAPADDPRVLVLVVVDEPANKGVLYGGVVAAPCASRILYKTLLHARVAPEAGSPLSAEEDEDPEQQVR